MQFPVLAHGVTCELPNGRRLFERLSFSLPAGISGLVGANGIGKSCLARILAGSQLPTEGSVQRSGAVTYLEQRETPAATPVRMYLGEKLTARVGYRLLAGIDPEAECDTLSGGQWMRVRLARVLDDAFLILDEPSNDLDRHARGELMEYVRRRRGGTLLISHDRECLELCDQILELTRHGLAQYGGGWSQYWSARAAERERLGQAVEAARRERDAALVDMRQRAESRQRQQRHRAAVAARGGMPRLLLGKRKRAAQESEGRLSQAAAARTSQSLQAARAAWSAMKIDPVMYAGIDGRPPAAQALIAEGSAFNVRYRDWIYERDLDFSWRGDLRLAIQGRNGAGKSTLLRMLRGASLQIRGQLRLGKLTQVCLDQDYSVLREELNVLENVALHRRGTESELRSGLAQFLFTGTSALQKVATLSGGERLRAALACEFMRVSSPELMLLDEPTNNLDAQNVEFLEQIVAGFRGALVVVSHDQRFLERCGVREEFVV